MGPLSLKALLLNPKEFPNPAALTFYTDFVCIVFDSVILVLLIGCLLLSDCIVLFLSIHLESQPRKSK